MVNRRRFFNPAQPQTLQIAVLLLYFTAVFREILTGLQVHTGKWAFFLVAAGQIFAGFGIANEKKWGYGLGITMAILPFLLYFLRTGSPFGGADILTIMFQVALVALLLHPQSRDYQRIWFK